MREMTKSLSKISLKSSSKQTDYEKFSSLWTKIWYCSGDVLCGRIIEFSIRSEIRRGRIRMNAKIGRKKANFVKGQANIAWFISTKRIGLNDR